jgi:hypothetical protein
MYLYIFIHAILPLIADADVNHTTQKNKISDDHNDEISDARHKDLSFAEDEADGDEVGDDETASEEEEDNQDGNSDDDDESDFGEFEGGNDEISENNEIPQIEQPPMLQPSPWESSGVLLPTPAPPPPPQQAPASVVLQSQFDERRSMDMINPSALNIHSNIAPSTNDSAVKTNEMATGIESANTTGITDNIDLFGVGGEEFGTFNEAGDGTTEPDVGGTILNNTSPGLFNQAPNSWTNTALAPDNATSFQASSTANAAATSATPVTTRSSNLSEAITARYGSGGSKNELSGVRAKVELSVSGNALLQTLIANLPDDVRPADDVAEDNDGKLPHGLPPAMDLAFMRTSVRLARVRVDC